MKKTWIVIAMLAALSCACDDDKDDSNVCVNGVKICSADGVRQECVNGAYIDIPCEKGSICSDGLCSPSTENCSSSSVLPYTGADGRSITYCVNSRIVTEPCPDGFTVAIGSYGAYCKAPESSATTDSKACSTNGAQRCSAAGVHQVCNGAEWVDQPCTTDPNEAAAWKCEAGECVHYTICFEGQTTCDGKTAMKCVKGARENMWQKSRDCGAEGTTCSAGRCVNDEYYDCSNEPYDGKTLAESFCNSSKPVALCVTCDSQHLWCFPKEDADARIGKSAASVGDGGICSGNTNPEPGGDATCDAYDCSSETLSGGSAILAECQKLFPDAVKAICNAERPFCVTTGSASCNAGETAFDYFYVDDSEKTHQAELGCFVIGDDKSCLDGGSSSGATCDVFDCGEGYTDQSTGKSLKETCALDGFSVALCGYNETGNIGYECANPATGSCESGSAYTSESGETVCLVVGTDKSCLDGGSSSSDAQSMTCSEYESRSGKACTVDNGQSCADYCGTESCCVLISSEGGSMDCGCQGGGSSSGSGDYSVCSDNQASCSASMPGSTPICKGNYYECSKKCTKENATSQLCDDLSGKEEYGVYPVVCTKVGNELYYVASGNATAKCSNGCNADNTACK